jgi:L-lactate dehydrogenase complex protein LldE
VALPRPDLCCGFGGTFSVRQPEVSVAMADDKLAGAATSGAEALVSADPGCLMHLHGRATRVGGAVPVVHLATALARGIDAGGDE